MSIAVGTKIRMEGERQRYTVTASDERYVLMWKPFNARRTYLYTIADLERGVRGRCNLIFGPAAPFNTLEGAAENLRMLQTGEQEVTHRGPLPLTDSEIAQLRPVV